MLARRRRRLPRHPLARLVHEALAAVLAPSPLEDVLEEALHRAGAAEIPETPAGLRSFVEGPLFAALAAHLEVSDAIELVAQVRSTLEIALATEEPVHSDVRETIARPGEPLLVATQASLVVFLLAEMVGEELAVVPVGDLAELTDHLRRRRGAPVHLVIDRKHPCVDVSVCALLRRELDARSLVVWWGASSAEGELALNLLAGGPRAIACEPDLRLSDLGELCVRLMQDAVREA